MNKRQHERHAIEHPAALILQNGIKIDCRVQNFSVGGLFIHPDRADWPEIVDNRTVRDAIVAIKLITPSDSKGSSIIVQASISYISSSGLGIAFLNQENGLLDYLQKLTLSSTQHQYSGNTYPKIGSKEISISEWVHSTTTGHLEARYKKFIKASCNTLFDAANATGDNQTQRSLFDAYNVLKTDEDQIKKIFFTNIDTSFSKFKHGNQTTDVPDAADSARPNMELVAKEDFEEWVSVVGLTRNLDHEISSKLHKLNDTLSYLTKTYVNNESNPVSPFSLLWAFKKSISDQNIALHARQLLFPVFKEQAMGDIGTLHDEIIQYLSDHGISYQAQEKTTRQPQQPIRSRTKKRLSETLSSLMGFVTNKRGRDNIDPKGVAPTEMVVKSLGDISTASHRPIIQRIEEQLAGKLINGYPAVVDQQTRDAIQVSENLFGSLQQDFMVNPEIQDLIDSLKIPFAREVITDPDLLNDANHPGHKLLETIGKLTPFLPSGEDNKSDKGYLFQALEEISKFAEQGAEIDIKEITGHLEHLIDHQKDNFQNNLDLVTQSCEQDELYLNARSSVLDLLCSKLTVRPIPKAVEELLHLGWAGLLVQTISALGEDDDNSIKLSGTLDLLLDIFDNSKTIKQVSNTQAEYLINLVRDGLSRYPVHAEESQHYITRLGEFLNSKGKTHPKLATEYSNLDQAAINRLLDIQATALHTAAPETEVEQSWLDLVSGIQLDDWIVEQRSQGHVRMLNLAWKNQIATRYVFVDGEGKKSLDTESNQLAVMFKQKHCSLLENGNLPIVERAVNRLLKNTFEQIKNDSDTDELTTLLGRKGFQREISELLEITSDAGDQHVMLELDIDQFSMINDLCGFKGGDKLLQTFANIINNYLPENTLLARIGDDEFGILIRNCTLDEAYHVAETQRRALENLRFTWDGTAIHATTSVGIIPIDHNIRSAAEVLNKTSSACRMAIQDGGNCTRIYQPTDSDIEKRKKLAQAVPIIEEALEKNKLALFVQPITPVFLGEDDEHHFEVLLRVKHDDGSWGSPEEFIQAAEQYNRMRSVDRWVINQIFSWLDNHHKELDGIAFSINLSAHTLEDETFPNFIGDRLDRSPFPNNRLTLEITETTLVKHIDKAKKLIGDIKSKGVKFSLDDFGTGYSSYSYLKDFPVDIVKIDGVFIKDILTDSSSYAMVKSITEISHHMGKKVVAEYVESEAILIALRDLEVDFAQGFGVGHPVPIKNILQHKL